MQIQKKKMKKFLNWVNRTWKQCGRKMDEESIEEPVDEDANTGEEIPGHNFPGVDIIAEPYVYSSTELATATDNYASIILEDAQGSIFRGSFTFLGPGHLEIAVQVFNVAESDSVFLSKIKRLIQRRHRNLINMIGWWGEMGKRIVVFEYIPPTSSLETCLHARTPEMEPLDWNTRMKIALDVARGLQFLHTVAHPWVLYKELRASNVLITDSMEAKLAEDRVAAANAAASGGGGYYAPECVQGKELTFKSDVYSFGVLLLELITGLKPFDESREEGKASLVRWVKPMIRDEKYREMADWKMGGTKKAGFVKVATKALECVRDAALLRPSMGEMVRELEAVVEENEISEGRRSSRAEKPLRILGARIYENYSGF